MPLLALGLNHQTAPLALRERVAVPAGDVGEALRELRGLAGVREAALLSTCNRTEIYAHVDAHRIDDIAAWLANRHGIRPDVLAGYLYQHHDDDAVRHLFRVAIGLDSLVLGEPQILGQVKEAWQLARNSGNLHTSLDRLFQQSFSVAKRVRTDTRIGAHPVSVAFAAVRLAVTGLAPKLLPLPPPSAVPVPLPVVMAPVITLPAGSMPALAPCSVPVTASSLAFGSLALEAWTLIVSVDVLSSPPAS